MTCLKNNIKLLHVLDCCWLLFWLHYIIRRTNLGPPCAKFIGNILWGPNLPQKHKTVRKWNTYLRASKSNNFDKHMLKTCWFKPWTGPMQSPNTTTSLAPCGSSWLMSHRHTAWQGTCIVTKDVKFGSLNIPWVKRGRVISVRPPYSC